VSGERDAVPLLWHFPISHYAEKARWALDWKGIPHRRECLFLTYVPRAWWATGQLSLPILHLEGRAVADSTAILAALEERWPERPLYPEDPTDRARALALEEFFDEELGHPIRTLLLGQLWRREPARAIRILATGQPGAPVRAARTLAWAMRAFYRARHDINAGTESAAPAKVEAALDRIERSLGPAGYLVGERFGVADLTAAALLAPLVQPDELEFPVDVALLEPEARRFRERVARREAIRWVREIYRKHRGSSAEI